MLNLLVHGLHPFPRDIETMLLNLHRLGPSSILDGIQGQAYDWEEGKNLDEARRLLRAMLERLEKESGK